MATQTRIGDITLDLGPSKKIDFGASRALAKFDIPGSAPDYMDMGDEERALKFSGVIDGDGAKSKADAILTLMGKGQEVQFIHGEVSAKVRIKSFNFSYERDTRVRYDIELIRVDIASGANGNSAAVNQVTTVSTTSAPSYNSFGELAGGVTGLLDQVPTSAYQVQQGDNLRSLCTKFYDTPHDWPTLAQMNGLSACNLPADLKQLSLPTSQEALAKAKSLIQTYATDKWPTLKLPTSWEDIA